MTTSASVNSQISLSPYGIHWFRRDLRIADNMSLLHNFKIHKGRILGIFCFDSQFLSRPDFSNNRFAFFMQTLMLLQEDFKKRGGELIVVDSAFNIAFEHIFKYAKIAPNMVSFGRDYEPYARSRDAAAVKLLEGFGVEVHTDRCHLIVEPHELLRDGNHPYQVFTPFGQKWFSLLKSENFSDRIVARENFEINFKLTWSDVATSSLKLSDSLSRFIAENEKHVTISIPKCGPDAAFKRLKKFRETGIDNYNDSRDFLGLDATSQMSLFLKNGSITSSQILAFLGLKPGAYKIESGKNRYLKEIVWREFYYSILWHHPRVENEAFLVKFKDIEWVNKKSWFRRWCEGTTGYPIVDAAMRQLNTTGWMHNRARMIVASFLTKDLLIDWRWGERYFMKQLLDGDLAANNGGWQWAASTGCDPQPYFRIFNPYLQSERFDPDGSYIRKYVSELKNVAAPNIHKPENVKGYPKPIVDHDVQKVLALQLYKTSRKL